MKNTKKLLAFFVAVAMLITVCIPFGSVFAANDVAATITITDVNGGTLPSEVSRNAEILVTITVPADTTLYGYTLNSNISSGEILELAGADANYVDTEDLGAITVVDDAAIQLLDGNVLAKIQTTVGRSGNFSVKLENSTYAAAIDNGDDENTLATVDVGNLTGESNSVKVASSGSVTITKPGSGGGGVVTGQSSACEITSFVFKGFNPVSEGVIDTKNYTIEVHVPTVADVTRLKPTIEISDKATISPASGVAQDFTEPVEYVVTAENGTSKRTYTVTVIADGEGEIVEEAPFDFVDLPENHWARPYIEDLVERGIISGDADLGTVRPDEAITRQEAAKIAVVGVALAESTGELAFADAASVADWAKGFVAAAAENGIVNGFEDNTFRPTENITREQFAAIMMRAFDFGESTAALTFTDADQVGWSKGYIAKAAELGIINGYEDNSFQPAANVTRAEAFKMLSVALDVAGK